MGEEAERKKAVLVLAMSVPVLVEMQKEERGEVERPVSIGARQRRTTKLLS